MKQFNFYNHLGFHNPYYIFEDGQLIIESDFENILSKTREDKVLDFTSLVEVFSTGFCFGDRTLIKGINKTPWMAKPNSGLNNWDFFEVPTHAENHLPKIEIVKTFYSLLEEELLTYITPYKRIGILLTGGMDSRIVACVLNNLKLDGRLEDKQVFAFTWGLENSRDVVYARNIAKLFNWDWTHLMVDETQMIENCNIAIENGCEFTPIHLHAMSQVSLHENIDCVLAGSFGDSVGRAEFSGRNVQELKSLEGKIGNIGGLLRDDFLGLALDDIKSDLKHYHELFPQKFLYQQFEQDQQLHYMRRMLNSCMNIINKKVPLFQMFSSPLVFGFMWSLDPKIRDNSIYFELLKNYGPELLEIPWARTGIKYNSLEGNPDNYLKKHHDYGKMIRTNFLEYVEDSIESNINLADKIFDVKTCRSLINNLRNYPINGGIVFEDRVLYIGQVLNFLNKYNVEVKLPKVKSSLLKNLKDDLYYKGKFLYKKLK
ncbi:asparagine synthase-related protein [Sphingobacterium sp. WM]|uniref:asparagine synthase-related protein n=1 Tax=Sphingobacterium sp. WM TaxID=3031802 RepID=UPI00240E143D|nr:asparagine synthase-related protein [Sphingobacterium sp. WM]WFB63286.1 asparagine synthase-related protein [Sphingobacterium sp. WM]